MGGQRAPIRPPLGDATRVLARPALLSLGVLCGLDLLGLFEREQQLIFGQVLGTAPEAVALQGLDDEAQPLALGTLLHEHRLEQVGIIGKGRSRRGHEQMRAFVGILGPVVINDISNVSDPYRNIQT